ncbi:hypothetical protein OH76DRAFT_1350899, partial [Lentinus brumalis]
RLLTPVTKLDEYDADPEAFRQSILDGKTLLHSCDWWVGLYNMIEAVPGKFKPGLLKNQKLVEIYLYIFRSQNSAEHESITTKKKKGQPSLQEKYKLAYVSLPSIVYVCCISEWRDTDGAWNAREFASTIYEYAGSHKQWVHNLLKWWNGCVFSVSRTFKY